MRVRLLAVLGALALGLAACGGGGGGGDEDQIRDLVKTFYGNEEGVCDSVTKKLLNDQFDSKDECEKAASQAKPEEGYKIEDVSVDGDAGTVDVTVQDQTGTLVVKKENGDWKVDGIKQAGSGGETDTTNGQ
jgi:hypothetical protein